MSRDYRVYLEDVLEAIRKIAGYTTGLSLEVFTGDVKTLDAVVRNLEVIGEAIKNVPDEVRSKHPEVDWKKIAGLRDVLIHAYFAIDVETVWDIVQNKLPLLGKQIKKILLQEGPG